MYIYYNVYENGRKTCKWPSQRPINVYVPINMSLLQGVKQFLGSQIGCLQSGTHVRVDIFIMLTRMYVTKGDNNYYVLSVPQWVSNTGPI